MAGPNGEERSVGRLMREALRKVRDTAPLYEQDDERRLAQSIEEISKDLVKLTAEFGELELNITTNTITLGEEAAYHSEARQNNVAFDFFRQGIRRLNFRPGLTHKEVDIFVRRFAECRNVDFIDEDFISTLWREPLEHISYLAIDAFTEKIFMAEEIFIGRFQGVIRDVMPGLLSMPEADTHDAKPRARKSKFPPTLFKRALKANESHPLSGAVSESLRALEMGLEPKTSFDLLSQHLVRFALKDPSPLSDEQLEGALLQLLGGYLKLRAWQGFADTLHSLWGLFNDEALSARHPARFEQLRRAVGGRGVAAAISAALEPKERNFTRWVRYFLVQAEALTAPELLEIINLCENQAGTALLQDVLRHQKSQSLDAWAERLKDPNPTVALEVLEVILSSDLQKQAQGLLLEVLSHPGAEVRARALEGLGELYDRNIRETLLPLIRDPSPEVRRAVLQRLVQAKDRSVSPYLASTIRSADFHIFGEEEQRSYCTALGELGGDKFLSLYQELLRMEEGNKLVRKLMQRGGGGRLDNDPLRRAAVDGLAVVGSPSALGLIREVRRRGSLELATHCDIALRLAERGEACFERRSSSTKKRRRRARQCSEEDIQLGAKALKVEQLFNLKRLTEEKQPPRPAPSRERNPRQKRKKAKRKEGIKFGQARSADRAPILGEGEIPPAEAEIRLILDPTMTGDGTFRLTSPRLRLKAAPTAEQVAREPSIAEEIPALAEALEAAAVQAEAPTEDAGPTPEVARVEEAPAAADGGPLSSEVEALLKGFLETPLEPQKLTPAPPPVAPTPPPPPPQPVEINKDADSVEGLLSAFLQDRDSGSTRKRTSRVQEPAASRGRYRKRRHDLEVAEPEEKQAPEEMEVDDLLKDFLAQDLGDS